MIQLRLPTPPWTDQGHLNTDAYAHATGWRSLLVRIYGKIYRFLSNLRASKDLNSIQGRSLRDKQRFRRRRRRTVRNSDSNDRCQNKPIRFGMGCREEKNLPKPQIQINIISIASPTFWGPWTGSACYMVRCTVHRSRGCLYKMAEYPTNTSAWREGERGRKRRGFWFASILVTCFLGLFLP